MVKLTIDGKQITAAENTTILQAAADNGINIPSLCYFKGLNDIGACRVCVVEIEGMEKLASSCNTKVEEGMVIHTNSAKAREARRTNVQLILAEHDCNCLTCPRSGNCALQTLARDLNISSTPFKAAVPENDWNWEAPIIKYQSKCIKCMRCVQVCDNIQSLGIWNVKGSGGRTLVGLEHGTDIMNTACALCGQCVTHCPTGALSFRDDTQKALELIDDPETITVVQVAPSVRTAWMEYYGIDREFATIKRMATALRKIGFDYVFDTNFSADLTIMEEASEFVERFTHKDEYSWPMFTSCCPGWVRFLKGQYPELTANLSTAKSPQGMFGAIAKTYFAERIGVDPHKIKVVSIMPCTAKKKEAALPTLNDACGDPDVDLVLTTRELVHMMRIHNIDAHQLEESELDSPLGEYTGAGVIFGATGGVMDAALRTAYALVTGENPDPDAFVNVRGMKGWKESTFNVPGAGEVHIAVASGLGNARKLIEAIKAGKVNYDFVEIMACPGGCAGGGGQPIKEGCELAEERGNEMWRLDKNMVLRHSHENPEIKTLYNTYLGAPLSEKAHHLLHTDQFGWTMPRGE
ncbi:MAG: (2Fe-2S)-binding protein [Firmicutes bacterium]|nr:(2Fe-2S)-binding protein [Bacillota bacterium]